MLGSSKQTATPVKMVTKQEDNRGNTTMTAIRNTAIAAIAALTIAASMASPANALSKKGAWALGIGLGTVAAVGAANAYGHGYYGYGGGYYGEGRAYRIAARSCARKYGWHTWRWENCMDRRGF
jgi:hypothetical protein